jgi:protein-S-isoprenylcysteine O-methyltransferase Ste14
MAKPGEVTILKTIGTSLAFHSVFTVGIPVLLWHETAHRHGLQFASGSLRWVGIVTLGFGVYLYCWSLTTLLRRETSALPGISPTSLVTDGWYARLRNPLLLGVVAILVGEAIGAGSLVLLTYALLYWGGLHLFVVFREERDLRSKFGPAYDIYSSTVPRWMPLFTKGDPSGKPSDMPD